MKYLISLLIFAIAQDLPYKSKEEFDIKLDYKFKQRPQTDANTFTMNESKQDYDKRTSRAPLPYLALNIITLKLSEQEVKVKITNNQNQNSLTKKVEVGSTIPIDFGFTDDVKDRVAPYYYKIIFLSAKKAEVSQITIEVLEDGSFMVNGEKRGKF